MPRPRPKIALRNGAVKTNRTRFAVVEIQAHLTLAGLLCSRICHDLVSPVGAIGNGIEVLAEERDPEMREQAIALIADSAERASHKLQYLRLALGATGGPGARIALAEAGVIARAWFSHTRYTLDWRVTQYDADRRIGRLLLNLILVGEESLPRGGQIEATMLEDGPDVAITVVTRGQGARLPAEWDLESALTLRFADLSPRGAQVCYAALLCHELGARLDTAAGADTVTISARVAGPI